MKIIRIFTLLALMVTTGVLQAQQGTIRGTVFEKATGEGMWGVQVFILNTSNGATSDFDGKFEIKIAPGTYDLKASFVGNKTVNITGLVVKANEVTVIDAIWMEEETGDLGVIEVVADAIKTTDVALLKIKQKSTNLIDGISSQQIKRAGDSDVAGAIRRVPGVSIQGGQYVFVRGLGDRYTKTILNGMEVPGLDPDRNAIQIDIFPTSLIDNIIVFKNFTPDLSADFVGGTVNIETVDLPTEKTFSASASIGYNPDMHFKNNFVTYNGGGSDFLGFDDGTRDLPFNGRTGNLPSPLDNDPELNRITRSFDPNMATFTDNSFANYSFSLSTGNQVDLGNNKFGYIGALNYRNTTAFYENAIDVAAVRPNESNVNQLENDTRFLGPLGTRDAQVSALLGGALKMENAKFKLQAMHIQNGTERAAKRTRVRSNENFNTSIVDNLEYTERSLTNLLASGEHYFNGNEQELTWKLSSTFSTINDKDIRSTPFTLEDDDTYSINAQEGGEPNRIWRLLDETNYVAKVDFRKNFDFNGRPSKLKVGASNIYKERDFEIQNFNLSIRGNQRVLDLNSDPNRLLAEENLWDTNDGTGVYVENQFNLSNSYAGRINTLGGYVSAEVPLTEKLKTIAGVRVEQYDQFYTGVNQAGANPNDPSGRVFDDENVLSSFEFFPSLNFIYATSESANLRASYSRTIARPSFKEKSTAEIQDVLTGRTFIGNIDLVETNINNYDLRWELFWEGGQTISVGAFYKTFTNPIELVRSSAQPNDLSPQNVGDATMAGIEVELRKNLGFLTPKLENFNFSTNVTFTEASVQMDDDERAGRLNGLRFGEPLAIKRDFLGQPPYIINTSLNYTDYERFWNAGVSYNVQGSTLAVVGINRTPDTFDVPFNSLNLNVSKGFGEEGRHQIGLRVTNILNDVREREFQSFGSTPIIETSRVIGTQFRIKYSYSITR